MMIPKKKPKKQQIGPMPNYIRNELKMTCAMKGFSDMKCGTSKRLADQYTFLTRFYHGDAPNYASQIKLLAEGKHVYRTLYDEVEVTTTKKKDNVLNTKRLKLKKIVTHDAHHDYYCGTNILTEELEKKNKTGPVLVGGRNLHDMAIRGVRSYRKALAYCQQKWDIDKLEARESGWSQDDVIEYVRRKMYFELVRSKSKDDDDSFEDSECEEVVDDVEVHDEENNVEDEDNVVVSKNTECDHEKDKGKDVIDNDSDDIDYEEEDGSHTSSNNSDDDSVPDEYIFPSYFVFISFGPFV